MNQHLTQQLALELTSGLQVLSLDDVVNSEQQQQLISYLQILDRWNRKINLSAVRSIREMVPRHLLDSLSALPLIEGPNVIDVGTGAGLPGIPLAITQPRWSVTMLDSAARKTRFVQQAIAELALSNASVQHCRVEDAQMTADTVVARAFSTPVDIISSCNHLLKKGGAFVLYMAHVGDKLDNLPSGYEVEAVKAVTSTENDVTRNIVVCRVTR